MSLLVPEYVKYVDKAQAVVCQTNISELVYYYNLELISRTAFDDSLIEGVSEKNSAYALFDEIAKQHKLKCTNKLTHEYSGICPSDGTCTVKINDDLSCTIMCDKHESVTSKAIPTTAVATFSSIGG